MDGPDYLEGCTMVAVCLAVKNKTTGEVTLGRNHTAAKVAAFRFKTGSKKYYIKLLEREKGDIDFIKFLEDNEFEDGFVNSIMEFFNRAKATQIRQIYIGVGDPATLLLSNKEIMRGAIKSGRKKTD